jgi:hypothetical protein
MLEEFDVCDNHIEESQEFFDWRFSMIGITLCSVRSAVDRREWLGITLLKEFMGVVSGGSTAPVLGVDVAFSPTT